MVLEEYDYAYLMKEFCLNLILAFCYLFSLLGNAWMQASYYYRLFWVFLAGQNSRCSACIYLVFIDYVSYAGFGLLT